MKTKLDALNNELMDLKFDSTTENEKLKFCTGLPSKEVFNLVLDSV